MLRKILVAIVLLPTMLVAQINTERVMTIARNALYFEDYVLSIQYFNQVINAKPYLYEPYFFRGWLNFTWRTFKELKPIATKLFNVILLWWVPTKSEACRASAENTTVR